MFKKFLTIVFAFMFYAVVGGTISQIAGLNIQVAGVNVGPFAMVIFLFGCYLLVKLPRGSLAMGYVKVNLTKGSDNSGKGGDKKDKVTLIDADDILGDFPSRDDKGIVIMDDIVMKPGAYAVDFYATQDSIKLTSKGEGEMDAKGIMQGLEFSFPGDPTELLEARQYWMNRNCYAIVYRCSTDKKVMAGAPCALLQLTFNAEDTKDSNKTTFTLASAQKGPDFADYRGTVTYDTVTGTIAADDASPSVAAGEGQYQLTDGTVAAVPLTSLDNATDGKVYTLLGSGGTYPSTIGTANDFVLKNGTAWSAIAGARITFKAFKSGASTWKFFEQSRA